MEPAELAVPGHQTGGAPPPNASGPEPSAAAVRVLVVDDNHDAADSLCLLLRLWGYETRAAYTGPAALEAARDFAPQVVLSELLLPQVDGYQLARHLRAEAATAVLIALTTQGRWADCSRAREAGYHFYLVKPADLAILNQLLARSCAPIRQ
jgi:DNA-binding response OmpR family regulator